MQLYSRHLKLFLLFDEGFEGSQNQSQDIQLLDAVLKPSPNPCWKIW